MISQTPYVLDNAAQFVDIIKLFHKIFQKYFKKILSRPSKDAAKFVDIIHTNGAVGVSRRVGNS